MARPAQRTGLAGRKDLITGGDSGIGRPGSPTPAMARTNYFPMEEPDAKEVIDLITAAATLARLKLHEKFYRSVEPNPDRLIIFALEPWNVCGFDGANLRVPNSCYPPAFRRVVWMRSFSLIQRVSSTSVDRGAILFDFSNDRLVLMLCGFERSLGIRHRGLPPRASLRGRDLFFLALPFPAL
jgi:hypothetical protein